MARSHKLTFLTKKRRIVDGEQHTHRRLVDGDGWQCFGVFDIGDGISNLKTFDAHQRTNFTGRNFFSFHFFETFEDIQTTNPALDKSTIFFAQIHKLAILEGAAIEATNGNPTNEAGVIQRSDQQLGVAFGDVWCRNVLYDGIQ